MSKEDSRKCQILVIEYNQKDEDKLNNLLWINNLLWSKSMKRINSKINTKFGEIWNPYTGPLTKIEQLLDKLVDMQTEVIKEEKTDKGD